MAAATDMTAATATVEAAGDAGVDAARRSAAVIELRMMAVVVMFFPRMVDDKAGTIAPATPTPVWRIAICGVAIAIIIHRSASAHGAGDRAEQNKRSD